jgi:hypothetical protein
VFNTHSLFFIFSLVPDDEVRSKIDLSYLPDGAAA